MKAAWTCREDIILRECIERGVSSTLVLARLGGRTFDAVRNRAKRLGLELVR